ncbi:hypothetical protein N825_12595 [Skermanella stibiiresistens SB22]|uniref:Acyl-CoA transferase n=1 Tax=Skermanella stibiiresistens SB22 TaxID=1385369 RepID=W9GXY2_9PROT|nr:hypothetical protein N825_12595 [Skermanella stibiiresistens SB22]
MAELPLSGLLVLDFSQFLAGPSCALRLADLGADVVKVERPQGGDLCRQLYVADLALDGDSALFHTINRNKRSVAADLKDPADLEAVKRLVARADVMIHNFRPGVMERLGLGFDAVAALNPRLVYGAVSGYGDEGPWRDKPGQDLLVQSLSGFVWLSGNADQGPTPAGVSVTDILTGAHLAQGILAALVRRGVTGRGGRVDVSLMESALDMQFEQLTTFLNTDRAQPRRSAVAHANVHIAAPYGVYQTADGYLALAMTPVDRLAELLDCAALEPFRDRSTWFIERDAIKAVIADHLMTRPTADWLAVLEAAGVWAAEVMTWPRLVEHDAFKALDVTQLIESAGGGTLLTTRCPIRIDGRILTSPRGAPRLGADTAAMLEEPMLDGNARVGE